MLLDRSLCCPYNDSFDFQYLHFKQRCLVALCIEMFSFAATLKKLSIIFIVSLSASMSVASPYLILDTELPELIVTLDFICVILS